MAQAEIIEKAKKILSLVDMVKTMTKMEETHDNISGIAEDIHGLAEKLARDVNVHNHSYQLAEAEKAFGFAEKSSEKASKSLALAEKVPQMETHVPSLREWSETMAEVTTGLGKKVQELAEKHPDKKKNGGGDQAEKKMGMGEMPPDTLAEKPPKKG